MICCSISCSRDYISEPVDDGLPPAIPSDLIVYAAFDGQVGLNWRKNSETDFKEYRIYRAVGSSRSFNQVGETNSNFFTDDSLEYDSTYYYQITAVDLFLRESNPTKIVSAQPKNIYIPYRPQSVDINARNWSNQVGIKLTWTSPIDTDIKGYEIYRSTRKDFIPDSTNYLDFCDGNMYFDTKKVNTLTEYFYQIRAVDKGNLKSSFTDMGSDLILDRPVLIFPKNNSNLLSLTEFRIRSAAKPARYKIVISYEALGVVKEIQFSSNRLNEEIAVPVNGFYYDSYRTYSWRVYTFTASDINPNSISEEFTFTFKP